LLQKILCDKGFKFLVALIFAGALLVPACSDDTYDNHYQADPDVVAQNNLWETIEAIPELSRFTALLSRYGYDKILSQTQAYTVFAPVDAALAVLDTTGMDVQTELVENHIARFILSASGDTASVIATLNKKRINLSNVDGKYRFGEAPFASPAKSLVASNGIIHVLDNYETFFPNVWEYLAKRNDLDSIKNYLYALDEKIFDASSSVPGGIVDGMQTYLDSVFFNYNPVLQRLGYINREDSSYTMIVPNNDAWMEAYNRVKEYYVYYNKNQQTADSMQRINTSYALVQDLIYNNNMQESLNDSLFSTSEHAYYYPRYLSFFENTEPVTTSNGTVYITDRLKFEPWESWHEPIVVEAERILGRENTLSTPSTVRIMGDAASYISSGRYLRLEPTTSSGNPTVTFEIPNTLSGAYNVYCVFVTGRLAGAGGEVQKPCRVYFNLSYLDRSGNIVVDRFPETGTVDTNPNLIDTVLVASDFKFPVANYEERMPDGELITTVTLKIISNVARSETTNFSRMLLLDCILLEPKKP
jgi:uncharacterized surface protein with fasciclin (FAS1) repeats